MRRSDSGVVASVADGYQQLIEGLPDAVLIVEEGASHYLLVNAAVERLLGYSRSELLGMSPRDLLDPADLPRLPEIRRQFLAAGFWRGEWRLRRKDGGAVTVEATNTRLTIDGRILYQGIFRDITERKQAEEALARREAQLAEAQRLAQLGSWEWDQATDTTTWSDELFRIFGLDPADGPVTADAAMAHVLPEDRQNLEASIETTRRTGVPYSARVRILRRDGDVRVLHSRGAVVQNAAGELTGMIGTAQDITERVRAEEAIEQERRERSSLLESTSEGVYGVDLDGRCTFLNRAGAAMLGYAPEEIKGKRIHALVHHGALDGSPCSMAACPVLTLPRTGRAVRRDDQVLYRRDGTRFPVEFSSSPIVENGRLAGAVVTFVDITRRKRAEEAIVHSETKYRRLFETMVQGVMYLAGDGTILAANSAAERILGRPLEQLQGRSAVDTSWRAIREDGSDVPDGERPSVVALRTGQPVHDVMMGIFNPKDAAWRWLQIDVIPERRPGEAHAYRAYVIFNDLTARRQAEDTLRSTQRVLVALVEASPLSIVTLDHEGRVVIWNPAAERTFGWSADEVQGQPVPIVPEDERADIATYCAEAARGASITGVRVLGRRKDGGSVSLTLSAAPLHDGHGNSAGVMMILTDMTEHDRAQERLLIQAAALDAAANAVIVTDRDGAITWVNPAFTRLSGYRPEEVLGQNPRMLSSGKHDPAFYRTLWETILDGRVWQGQMTNRRKDGSIYVDESTITPIRRADGTIGHFISIKQDVTQRERDAEALRRTNQELADALERLKDAQAQIVQHERLRALGQMASGIAHDFNNALAPIAAYSELLLAQPERLGERERVTSFLETIHTAAQDATEVVRKLRDFYRPRQPDEVLEAVSLEEIVAQVISLTQFRWKDQALARGVRIVVKTELRDLPPVAGRPAELRDALTNLVLNAVDALPEGGTISIEGRVEGGRLALSVRDTGEGMSEEVRRRCLEPFFTTKGEQGTGLGMGLVYGIVQRHQGTLEIESARGVGTTITARLPIWVQPVTPTVKARTSETPRLRVLVIDDKPSIRRLLAEYLALDGHTIATASDGRNGLERLHSDPFDLVLTDRALPEMSGDDLACEIKRLFPSLPVIMITGFGDLMHAESERPYGVDLVVGKPVSLKELRQAIAQVTAARRSGA